MSALFLCMDRKRHPEVEHIKPGYPTSPFLTLASKFRAAQRLYSPSVSSHWGCLSSLRSPSTWHPHYNQPHPGKEGRKLQNKGSTENSTDCWHSGTTGSSGPWNCCPQKGDFTSATIVKRRSISYNKNSSSRQIFVFFWNSYPGIFQPYVSSSRSWCFHLTAFVF